MTQKKRQVRPPEGYIFIGNVGLHHSLFETQRIDILQLHPFSTEAELTEMFKEFGKLKDVSIRVVRGEVADPAAHSSNMSIANTHIYAVLCYRNLLNARKAMEMNGVVHRGRPLVVSTVHWVIKYTVPNVSLGY
jgi:RNA recognition motif-containing protein